jgi:hypothetical protein
LFRCCPAARPWLFFWTKRISGPDPAAVQAGTVDPSIDAHSSPVRVCTRTAHRGVILPRPGGIQPRTGTIGHPRRCSSARRQLRLVHYELAADINRQATPARISCYRCLPPRKAGLEPAGTVVQTGWLTPLVAAGLVQCPSPDSFSQAVTPCSRARWASGHRQSDDPAPNGADVHQYVFTNLRRPVADGTELTYTPEQALAVTAVARGDSS